MPTDSTCCARCRRELPQTQVIILTANDSLTNAIESIKQGAFHFISKPYAPEELLSLIGRALEQRQLVREAGDAARGKAAAFPTRWKRPSASSRRW